MLIRIGGGLSGANVNILNGADGLGEMAAGLVGQGLSILDSVQRGLSTPPAPAVAPEANGQVTKPELTQS